MKNKKISYILLITIMLMLIIITKGTNIFGSTTDWFNQHVAFADYFRNLYFETGNIIQNYALNIGAGSNIYNLSYYGLYNPLLLVSYLIPHVSMEIYLSFLNMFLYITTGVLSYYFLSNKYENKYALTGSILFILASPILFHFHRQYMFVNYLPFLLLAFIGIDKKKNSIIAISSFLIIMSSYYFALPSLIAIIIYYIYINGISKKKIVNIIKPIIIACLMSAILTLPTLSTIISNRSLVVNTTPFYSLFLPNITFQTILYNEYTMGVSLISVIALIASIFINDKKTRNLSISLLIITLFGIFSYLFNGFLYVRSKTLIPFIILIIIVVIEFLKYLDNHKVKINKKLIGLITILILISFITVFMFSKYIYVFIIDLLLTALGFYLFYKKKTTNYLIVCILISTVCIAYFVNINEKYISASDTYVNSDINELLDKDYNKDLSRTTNLLDSYNTVNRIYNSNYLTTNIYSSTENSYYYNFVKNIFRLNSSYDNSFIINSSSSVLFNTLMANRYLIDESNKNYLGYDEISGLDEKSLYENTNVLPLIYSTNHLYSEKEFDILPYESSLATMMNGVVTPNSTSDAIIKDVVPYNFNGTNPFTKNNSGKYIIDTKENSIYEIPLNDTISNKILLISFSINGENCSSGERTITINGIKNSISCDKWLYANHNSTFTYQLSDSNISNLIVEFSKGHYEISNIKLNTINYNDIVNYVSEVDKISNIEYSKESITGSIHITHDGYLATSIPYDKNLKIYIDNNLVNSEIINKAFLGTKINAGDHSIKIVYKDKNMDMYKIISVIGLMMFIVSIIREGKEYE